VPPAQALAIAHRAGNHLPLLYAAERTGADLIEADLWSYRGRVEVRHLRTFGELPLPVLWDRWQLARGWGERLSLSELLAAAAPTTRFLLDLKGVDVRLASQVRRTMAALAPDRPYAVCSQSWELLEAFRGQELALVVHSVGDERMLRSIQERLTWHEHQAVGLDHRLLTAPRVADLRDLVPWLFAWTVNTESRMRQLVEWGVNGIISDRFEVLDALLKARAAQAP
jgi:glycerophosphoryl diester phosphodiesterase